MNWLSRLERRFGRLAIPNLPLYIVILYGIGTILNYATNGNFYSLTCFSPYLILHGHQYWRLVSFIMAIHSGGSLMGLIFLIFIMFFYYMIGQSLVQVWGAFRFTMYIFIGLIGTVAAGFLAYGAAFYMKSEEMYYITMDTYYLVLSMFLAYAAIFPEVTVYLYGIVPLKIKWLALLDLLLLATDFISGGTSARICIVVSLLNFLLFFFSSRNYKKVSPKEIKRRARFKKSMNRTPTTIQPEAARHRCAVCGRTEKDNPELEFRFCSKCNGNYEYCNDHLFTHEHVK